MIVDWSVTLGWRDILNIVLGLITVSQFFRIRRTNQVCTEVLRRHNVQTAAHGFAEMSKIASELETWVGKSEWERSLELAKRLMVSLAEASGAWTSILETKDVDNFDAARSEIRSVESAVSSADQNPPPPEKREEMKLQCMNTAIYLTTIAGRLKRPSELEEPKPSALQRLRNQIGGPKRMSDIEVIDLKKTAKEVKQQ